MNPHLEKRLSAILDQLNAVHGGGAPANATRGAEREAFAELLLRSCVPLPYRFGSGEITDASGRVSGQIDLVIEHPFYPSFPLLGTSQHRLYMIEGVAMGIEVKSSEAQFSDGVATMKKFYELELDADWPPGTHVPRIRGGRVGSGGNTSFPGKLGFAIVLYKGWQQPQTLRDSCDKEGVPVALQLDPPIFYAKDFQRENNPTIAEGASALAAFLFVVSDELKALTASDSDVYRRYVLQERDKTFD